MMSISCAHRDYLTFDAGTATSWGFMTLYTEMAIPLSDVVESCEFGLPPSQGPRGLMGDRICSHVNYKGAISNKMGIALNPEIDFGYGITLPGRVVGSTKVACLSLGLSRSFSNYEYLSGKTRYVYSNRSISVHGSPGDFWLEAYCDKASYYNGVYVSTTLIRTRRHYTTTGLVLESVSQTRAVQVQFYNGGTLVNTISSNKLFSLTHSSSSFNDCEAIKARLVGTVSTLLSERPSFPANFEDNVRLDAVEACRVVKVNVLALAHDIRDIKSIASWARAIPKVRSLKQAASAYLGYEYGAPLTFKDVLKVARNLSALPKKKTWRGHSIARSRASTQVQSVFPSCSWSGQKTVKLVYDPVDKAGEAIVRSLYDYGMAPTMVNMWDFIPFSFVLGWAVNVTDYLERIDAEEYLHTVNIRGVVESDRWSITLPGPVLDAGLEGTFELVLYDRSVSSTVSIDDPSFSLSNPFNHLLEGGALILAHKK